jgi:hypothetical protein
MDFRLRIEFVSGASQNTKQRVWSRCHQVSKQYAREQDGEAKAVQSLLLGKHGHLLASVYAVGHDGTRRLIWSRRSDLPDISSCSSDKQEGRGGDSMAGMRCGSTVQPAAIAFPVGGGQSSQGASAADATTDTSGISTCSQDGLMGPSLGVEVSPGSSANQPASPTPILIDNTVAGIAESPKVGTVTIGIVWNGGCVLAQMCMHLQAVAALHLEAPWHGL